MDVAAQDLKLADLSFMTGCWNGPFESRGEQGVIQERYSRPSQNVMLGTTQYLIGARTVQFELTTILLGDSGIVMTPYPGGRASDGFPHPRFRRERMLDLRPGPCGLRFPVCAV